MEDDLEIRSTDGRLILKFDNPEQKKSFEGTLRTMCGKNDLIREEGYACGHCAAYPCYRQCEPTIYEFMKKKRQLTAEEKRKWLKKILDEASTSAGLCFQRIRRCRQECSNYNYKEFPARGGKCRADDSNVDYEQECHIDKLKHGDFKLESLIKELSC